MSQWGKTDNYTNSVFWAASLFNLTANSGAGSNQQRIYNNVTEDSIVVDEIVGQFGVDTTEIGVGSGNVAQIIITNNGSGYSANGNLTFTGGGGASATANAVANTTGKISSIMIVNGGSSYETNPTVAVSAPTSNSFNANSAVSAGAGGGANSVITVQFAGKFVAGDPVTYSVATGNTAVGGLVSGTKYYVQFANATVVALATDPSGSRITLTKGFTEAGHTLQGDTATATAIVGGAANKGVPHAGWVVRTVGTGGRAGRVQYETLVAMGTITSDGTDDSVLPDA